MLLRTAAPLQVALSADRFARLPVTKTESITVGEVTAGVFTGGMVAVGLLHRGWGDRAYAGWRWCLQVTMYSAGAVV
jgi:hypothetical protein